MSNQNETQQSGEPTPAQLAEARRLTAQARQVRSKLVDPADVHEEDEDTVTMIFPRACRLLTNDRKNLIQFPAGTQEVPAKYADHPYLKANGAVRYVPKLAKTPKPEPELPKGAIAPPVAEKAKGKSFVKG